jgi:hypothetical protein
LWYFWWIVVLPPTWDLLKFWSLRGSCLLSVLENSWSLYLLKYCFHIPFSLLSFRNGNYICIRPFDCISQACCFFFFSLSFCLLSIKLSSSSWILTSLYSDCCDIYPMGYFQLLSCLVLNCSSDFFIDPSFILKKIVHLFIFVHLFLYFLKFSRPNY